MNDPRVMAQQIDASPGQHHNINIGQNPVQATRPAIQTPTDLLDDLADRHTQRIRPLHDPDDSTIQSLPAS